MANQAENPADHFDAYFARTQELPPRERTQPFLEHLPSGAQVLDFGCGTGRWAAAFLRDRPDLKIDLVDQHLDKANLIAPDWPGERFQIHFKDFKPHKNYNGIWAFATLFFLPHNEMESTFRALAGSLLPGGIMAFSMVEDCPAASQFHLSGMNRTRIEELLAEEKLHPLFIRLRQDAPYGRNQLPIPTFYVFARKAG